MIAGQASPGRAGGDAARSAGAGSRAAGILGRLRGVLLLSGAVRETRLRSGIGISLLDLPIDRDRTLIGLWREHVGGLAEVLGRPSLPVRVMLDQVSAAPSSAESAHGGNGQSNGHGDAAVTIQRDPYDYRGTGGVLRDLAEDYDDRDYLLVANGAQVLLEPLADLAAVLAGEGADVCVIAHRDGTPSGLTLARCGALRVISRTGFIDLKEQGLPEIAKQQRVGVLFRDRPTGLPVRTLSSYMTALRMHHLRLANRSPITDPFAEHLESSFSIVQHGAEVDPSARVHDSVVLRGGRVGPDAILVRSMVCGGAAVGRDSRIVDRLLPTADRERNGRGA